MNIPMGRFNRKNLENNRRNRTIAAALVLQLLFVSAVTADPLPTEPGTHNGLFVVEDAVTQLATLKHHGEALGWRNLEASGAPDPTPCDHIQGIVRYPGSISRPVFYVSQLDSSKLPPGCGAGGSADGGYLSVVQFGSRGSDGERLRSNLQEVGNDTEETSPPTNDKWIRSIRFDGTLDVGGQVLPAFKHPGGPAIIDGYLLVPADQPLDSGDPDGVIVIFDLSNPLDPQAVRYQVLAHGIDNLGVTRRDDGSYLVWTNGASGNEINVYSTMPNANLGVDPLFLDHTWDSSTDLTSGSWPTGTGAHQASTFLREPDGSLYLLGMRNDGGGLPDSGSDWVDLFRVTDSPPGHLSLADLGDREFNCVYDGGGGLADMRICHFGGGSTAYVSPTGELILYSMPHDDEDTFSPDIVRMGEFRHRDVLRPGNPLISGKASAGGPYIVNEGGAVQLVGTVPDFSEPWFVELYDDVNYADRSIVIDYQDRSLLELNNFNNLDGFNDKTSSVRWRLPIGVTAFLWEHDGFDGNALPLTATGSVSFLPDLDNQGFGDKTSSVQFAGSPPVGPPTVSWDLDGDGIFGETGSSATYGNENLDQPTFIAAGLDGPETRTVNMRVTPAGELPKTYSANVKILNVPPSVALNAELISGPGLGGEVELTVVIGDPGTQDKLNLEIDWDDGSPVQQVELSLNRETTQSHTYVAAVPISPSITVSADDGDDTTTRSVPITIEPCVLGVTFNDGTDGICHPCATTCPAGFETSQACTLVSDTQCGNSCAAGATFNPGDLLFCQSCRTTCPAGTGAVSDCLVVADAHCEPCPPGTENDGSSLVCTEIIATYTVTPSAGPGGQILPATAQVVEENATVQFTLEPVAGFHIDSVGGSCGGTLAGASYTTSAVTADCTVEANFAANSDESFEDGFESTD